MDEIGELAELIRDRMREHGCTCRLVVIRLAQTDGAWFADVTHDKGCPHDWPDEYVDGFT